jgi:Uma2 family endonuclease
MSTSTQDTATAFGPESEVVPFPPMENGDRLTRPEFERLYDAMPDLKKAELIEGIVRMGSPVGFRRHSAPHFDAIGWLSHYRAATAGVIGGDNGSIRLDLDNMPQPDIFLIISPEHGGQVRVSEDDYVELGPELVVEIAASSVSYDLHEKLEVYRRNGAREYLVWRVKDRTFDWFVLREGRYHRIQPADDGTLRSEVFPGLWLDPEALIRGDLAAVFQAVQRGLATPEHAAFVERLRQATPQ